MKLQLFGEWLDFIPDTVELLESGVYLGWNPGLPDNQTTDASAWAIALNKTPPLLPVPVPWLLWNRSGDEDLTVAAYHAGAQAVLPAATPKNVVNQALFNLINLCESAKQIIQLRRYQRGDTIFLDPETVIRIESGVVSIWMVHKDGVEVLLGLSGPGQILVTHPPDECFIQFSAHTNCELSVMDWDTAERQPNFTVQLRARLRQMEAWAAMQARPYLDQRLYGVLGLLAEQFGQPNEQGVIINVRITHAQLASAIGSTRTTITRLLGELRNSGKLSLIGSAGKEYFCLHDHRQHPHH
jgi:CRP-like cAMP-binding protein